MEKSSASFRVSASRRARIRRRTRDLRRAIDAVGYILEGTLRRRMKVCGRPNCRCADDPDARHGPYYEWSRLEKRRLVQRALSEEQAAWVEHALANYRRIQKLLRQWEAETVAEIFASTDG